MKKSELKKLQDLIFFTKEAFRSLSKDDENTVSKNISRWIKSGDLILLKNGLYTTKLVCERYSKDSDFHELIASVLIKPSYLSLEYVLGLDDVLTQGTYPITCVTLKTGGSFVNKTGTYIYKHIKRELFCGYQAKNFLEHQYFIATKTKALFDYLYYKLPSLADDFERRDMVEDLRLKLDLFSKKELKRLDYYAKIAKNKKLDKLIKNIQKYASH
jgi:predicted transcriptional regulator of viral defense system